ncbi:MAG: hypothetical protein QOJ69_2329 [Actinomycetota bacterium]|nr:hypothetical protein [Actinomycetota bacterium]
MAVVGTIKLTNNGHFVARLGLRWIDPNGNAGSCPPDGQGDIDEGQSGSIDPGSVGCPESSQVWPWVDVVWGDDKSGSEADGLVFQSGIAYAAEYTISGTTLDDHLSFEGVAPTSTG